jgi:hypothetical protein
MPVNSVPGGNETRRDLLARHGAGCRGFVPLWRRRTACEQVSRTRRHSRALQGASPASVVIAEGFPFHRDTTHFFPPPPRVRNDTTLLTQPCPFPATTPSLSHDACIAHCSCTAALLLLVKHGGAAQHGSQTPARITSANATRSSLGMTDEA